MVHRFFEEKMDPSNRTKKLGLHRPPGASLNADLRDDVILNQR